MVDKTQSPFASWNETLETGIHQLISVLEEKSGTEALIAEVRNVLPLLEQMKGWVETMPPEKFRATFSSLLSSLHKILLKGVEQQILAPSDYGASMDTPAHPVVVDLLMQLGPEIEVSEDQMVASVSIPEEFASIWIPERIQEGLQRQGVVGIDTKILPEVTQHPDVLYPVATGKEPESGQDAELVDELGLTEVAGKPTERSDRSVNMKELNFIKNVNQGQVLMRKNPVRPGVPGVNVFGEPIPCREGEDVEFPSIPNAELSEDGYSLVSTINGCAYKEGSQLHLVSTFEVQKNVDYSIGNIDASVAVHVNGDVLTGFRVESREDIIVKGTTEGCHLLSRGNIFLPGGVQGKEEAIIRAKKNVDAKFFNEANVTAGGAVIVHGAVILSRIRCQRLELEGNDAVIKGGEIEAAIDVCADSIGSDIGSKTKITLGHDLRELEDKLETLAEDIQNARDRLQRFEESRENLRKMQEKNGYLPPDKEKLKEKVESSLAQAQERLEEKETNREKKQIELENARQIVRTVRVRKKIMPGVEIDILGHSISFKTPSDPVTVIVIDDEIQVVPFQERSFEEADEMDIE